MEYYIAFDDNYHSGGSLDYFNDMMERSIRHYLMILEDCPDEKLRNKALWGLILDYKYTNRLEEAKKYAMIYPEYDSMSRDDALELCLEGDELLAHRQNMLADALYHINKALNNIYGFGNLCDPRVRAAAEASLAVYKAVIPDENYLGFSGNLYSIHVKLAEIAVANENYDTAVRELAEAKKYAAEMDRCMVSGKQYYTCLLLDHYDYDYSDCRPFTPYIEYWQEKVNEPQFALLCDCEDFKALL